MNCKLQNCLYLYLSLIKSFIPEQQTVQCLLFSIKLHPLQKPLQELFHGWLIATSNSPFLMSANNLMEMRGYNNESELCVRDWGYWVAPSTTHTTNIPNFYVTLLTSLMLLSLTPALLTVKLLFAPWIFDHKQELGYHAQYNFTLHFKLSTHHLLSQLCYSDI